MHCNVHSWDFLLHSCWHLLGRIIGPFCSHLCIVGMAVGFLIKRFFWFELISFTFWNSVGQAKRFSSYTEQFLLPTMIVTPKFITIQAVALGELGAVTCIFKFDKLQSASLPLQSCLVVPAFLTHLEDDKYLYFCLRDRSSTGQQASRLANSSKFVGCTSIHSFWSFWSSWCKYIIIQIWMGLFCSRWNLVLLIIHMWSGSASAYKLRTWLVTDLYGKPNNHIWGSPRGHWPLDGHFLLPQLCLLCTIHFSPILQARIFFSHISSISWKCISSIKKYLIIRKSPMHW